MKSFKLPKELTYFAVFLSFRCGYNCSYCINRCGDFKRRKEMDTDEWLEGLNRLELDRDKKVPITLQGGEPSKHSGFIDIINGLKDDFYIDILTNLDFNVKEFAEKVDPNRLTRDVPYGSIRVSYHPEQDNLGSVVDKVKYLQDAGFDIGLFTVEHPSLSIQPIKDYCQKYNIDFRTKEFLGIYQGVLWGQYKYDGLFKKDGDDVYCKTTELLVSPSGYIHRCHSDLYGCINPVAHITDEKPDIHFCFRSCSEYGHCNPCDVKIKNDRFQRGGSCSVEIQEVNCI